MSGRGSVNHNEKITAIPVWDNDEPFSSYSPKLMLWDASTNIAPSKKLISFLNSLENRKEEKKRLSLEIFDNKVIDPNDPDILRNR